MAEGNFCRGRKPLLVAGFVLEDRYRIYSIDGSDLMENTTVPEMKQMSVCPHCRKEVDPAATKCPHCQSDLRSWARRHKVLTGLLGVLAFFCVLTAIGAASSGGSVATTRPAITDSDYINGLTNVMPPLVVANTDGEDASKLGIQGDDTDALAKLQDAQQEIQTAQNAYDALQPAPADYQQTNKPLGLAIAAFSQGILELTDGIQSQDSGKVYLAMEFMQESTKYNDQANAALEQENSQMAAELKQIESK